MASKSLKRKMLAFFAALRSFPRFGLSSPHRWKFLLFFDCAQRTCSHCPPNLTIIRRFGPHFATFFTALNRTNFLALHAPRYAALLLRLVLSSWHYIWKRRQNDARPDAAPTMDPHFFLRPLLAFSRLIRACAPLERIQSWHENM